MPELEWAEMTNSQQIEALLDLVDRLSIVTERWIEAYAALEDRVKTLELSA